MALEISPLRSTSIESAVRLLEQRAARHRARDLAYPPFDATATRAAVERTVGMRGAFGVMAHSADEPAGYLVAYPVLGGPEDLDASDYPPRTAVIPAQAHALADDVPATTYGDLYAHLALSLVADGWLNHVITVPAGDAEALDQWFALGFGQLEVGALGKVTSASVDEAGVSIRRVGVEAIDEVESLCWALNEHLERTPSFFPAVPEALPAWRAATLPLLADPANAYFVAYRGDAVVGMATFMDPWAFSAPMTPERCIYLDQGVVDPVERRGGVGRALVATGLNWAADQGYRWCGLHYVSSNLSAARFWPALGFRPYEYKLIRRIDPRIRERRASRDER